MEYKDIISNASGLATVVTAIFIVMQYCMANKQSHNDSFERRWNLYEEVRKVIATIGCNFEIAKEFSSRSANANAEDEMLFLKAVYVFDDKLAEYLKEHMGLLRTGTRKKEKFDKLGTYHANTNSWIFDTKFEAQFDRFLKLK